MFAETFNYVRCLILVSGPENQRISNESQGKKENQGKPMTTTGKTKGNRGKPNETFETMFAETFNSVCPVSSSSSGCGVRPLSGSSVQSRKPRNTISET